MESGPVALLLRPVVYPQRYGITYDDEMEKLSPGTRGIVLFLLYLALDDADRPLIIKQPEESLDPQSGVRRTGTPVQDCEDETTNIHVDAQREPLDRHRRRLQSWSALADCVCTLER